MVPRADMPIALARTAEGERLVASIALHHRTEVKLLGDVFRDLAAQLH